MADPRSARHQATSSTVSWNTDDAYEYIVLVLGHQDKIPQRYDYTLGTEEMLRRLRARYGVEHGMKCVGLLRWHLGLEEDNEVVDETIWRNWRNYFARHRVGNAFMLLFHALIELCCQDSRGPGPARTLQERILMWDDGNADRIGQVMNGMKSGSSAVASRSFGKLKRSISNAVEKLKGKNP